MHLCIFSLTWCGFLHLFPQCSCFALVRHSIKAQSDYVSLYLNCSLTIKLNDVEMFIFLKRMEKCFWSGRTAVMTQGSFMQWRWAFQFVVSCHSLIYSSVTHKNIGVLLKEFTAGTHWALIGEIEKMHQHVIVAVCLKYNISNGSLKDTYCYIVMRYLTFSAFWMNPTLSSLVWTSNID